MNFHINRRPKYRFDISIDLKDIEEAIITEGTWHPADNATAYGTTSANLPIIDRRVKEGLDDLLARMAGYIVGSNVNFNLESENIVLAIGVQQRPMLSLAANLKQAIINALANYVLMSLYGDEDSVFGTAWRLHRARIMLLLC